MSIRYRRRVKLFPGVHLNLSKSGVTVSVGVRGANVTLGRTGTYLNTGLPGTGIYSRTRISPGTQSLGHPAGSAVPSTEDTPTQPVESIPPEGIANGHLGHVLDLLKEIAAERKSLAHDIARARHALFAAKLLRDLSFLLVVGFAVHWFRERVHAKRATLEELQSHLANCKLNVEVGGEAHAPELFTVAGNIFDAAATCKMMWHVTGTQEQNAVATRSGVAVVVQRVPVTLQRQDLDLIASAEKVMCFRSSSNIRVLFYPGFVVVMKAGAPQALFEWKELTVAFAADRMVEHGSVPSDAEIVDRTWLKVNKDGSPDRRFKDNPEFPVAQYGRLAFTTEAGLAEAFSFSSFAKARALADALIAYRASLAEG